MARLPQPRERETRAAETAVPTEVELKLALDAAAVPRCCDTRPPASSAPRPGHALAHDCTVLISTLRLPAPSARNVALAASAASAGAGSRRSRAPCRRTPAPACTPVRSTNGRCGVRASPSTGWRPRHGRSWSPRPRGAVDSSAAPHRLHAADDPARVPADGSTAELCVDVARSARHAAAASDVNRLPRSRSSSRAVTRPTCFGWRSRCPLTCRLP